jgi:hypothetical protein
VFLVVLTPQLLVAESPVGHTVQLYKLIFFLVVIIMAGMLEKVYVSSRGNEFQQFFQRMPIVAPLYTQMEADYDVLPIKAWCADHWEVPIAFVVVYLLGIFFGQKFMASVEYKVGQAQSSLFLDVIC